MQISTRTYNTLLLLIAGLGGLLYGIDIGIIAAALPYLNASIGLSDAETSLIVAAVLGGSMLSSLAAGFAADRLGRKRMMLVSAALFLASILVIASADGFRLLFFGRLLQGVSGGIIAVVVPLYLAECLDAGWRGRGSAIFQFMLTLGIVLAAGIGFYYTRGAESAIRNAHGAVPIVIAAQKHAWRSMFLTVAFPGMFFLFGTLFLGESPRWLLRKGRAEEAFHVLSRSTNPADASEQLAQMQVSFSAATRTTDGKRDLLQRKYMVPFLLACAILMCNQATGINSILSYLVVLLKQGGMNATLATESDFWVKVLNCVATLAAAALVDRKGRKFLLALGTAGACIALSAVAFTFHKIELQRQDVSARLQARVVNNAIHLRLNDFVQGPVALTVRYHYAAGEHSATVLSTDPEAALLIKPVSTVGLLRLDAGYTTPIPPRKTAWLITGFIALFIVSFAVGPGVIVWLALSELMPTRIRSSGMGIALLLNQGVSTLVAGLFLPVNSRYGNSTIFTLWALSALAYFLIATVFLPETKGKTLEEVELHFVQRTKERTA